MSTTLVVLAAGMGSRYGGLKQIDPIGPNGEVIIELSVYAPPRNVCREIYGTWDTQVYHPSILPADRGG